MAGGPFGIPKINLSNCNKSHVNTLKFNFEVSVNLLVKISSLDQNVSLKKIQVKMIMTLQYVKL